MIFKVSLLSLVACAVLCSAAPGLMDGGILSGNSMKNIQELIGKMRKQAQENVESLKKMIEEDQKGIDPTEVLKKVEEMIRGVADLFPGIPPIKPEPQPKTTEKPDAPKTPS